MDALVVFIPLMPLLAALIIGLGNLFKVIDGEHRETVTADVATWTLSMSLLLALTLLGADLLGNNDGYFIVGQWLTSDTLNIDLNFITSGINVRLAALFSILLLITCRFSINYMHRETGFHRFFFLLSLFASAMLLLVLSGNAA
ncbi:MAG: hypothetical protein Q8S55_00120, partial [Methylococcaceae bacterium]|nr:hypothetical protein [Methylococcaceae bacterium]